MPRNSFTSRFSRIDVEKVIFAFGLLTSLDGKRSKWRIAYHFGVSLFVLANLIRFLALLLWVPAGSLWGVYLGDIAYYMAPEERDNFQMLMIIANAFWLVSPFYFYQESVNKGEKMEWLTLLKTCSFESFDFGGIGLCRENAIRFRNQVRLVTWLCVAYVASYSVVCFLFAMFVGTVKFPDDYRLTFGVLHGVIFSLDCYYIIGFSYAMTFVFHQISRYFVVRFDGINSKVKFLKNRSLPFVRGKLLSTLKDMNSVYNQIYKFNQFWKYILIIDFSLILLIISLLSYFAFFSRIDDIVGFLGAIAAVMVFLVLSGLSLSAASVVKSVC